MFRNALRQANHCFKVDLIFRTVSESLEGKCDIQTGIIPFLDKIKAVSEGPFQKRAES